MLVLDPSLIAIVTLSATVVGLAYLLIRALVASYEARTLLAVGDCERKYVSMRTEKDNYHRMAAQATIILENRVNAERLANGEEPFPVIAAVLPEHNSPPSPEQERQAEFATLRARVTAAALELGEEVPDVKFRHYDDKKA